MREGAFLRQPNYLRVPCEIGPNERQGRPADLSDIAMVLTVERCYPGEIDAAMQNDEYDDLLITRFIQEKYSQALIDFGFAQARGLELGMLGRSALSCERKAGHTCEACPINSLYEDFSDRITGLENLAQTCGLSQEEFRCMYHWAVEAAANIPEAFAESSEAVDDMLAVLGEVRN